MIWFVFNLAFTVAWRDSVQQCNGKITTWLYVYTGVFFLDLLHQIICYCVLSSATNPIKKKNVIDLLYVVIVETFRFAWLIYGNTIIYTDESMECKHMGGHARGLWRLMMANIAIGYLYLGLLGLLFCCGACALCCMLCCASGGAQNSLVDKIPLPYMDAVKSLKKKKFADIKDKHMDQCAICM